MPKFAAFLRGINIGGHKKVPMEELKAILQNKGYKAVSTVLASGNVVFESSAKNADMLHGILEKAFGFSIPTIIIPFIELLEIIENNPFQEFEEKSNIKCYVTFTDASDGVEPSSPITTEENNFEVIGRTKSAVFSVLNSDEFKTTEAMKILEKKLGKKITTRNYNTLLKVARL